ncbi:hypothetical protein LI90_3519 [Carbonactinospora thermoautotrophica]|uniref:Uncharacterized protein n=1 Tax=Carbonactinospora thermoautotrophica TaxID=1469144 RepID=A0A132MXL4_9ACTN|nr:hypothetical protein LI90_3519 [Carbonactinospora thermoautotrophica]
MRRPSIAPDDALLTRNSESFPANRPLNVPRSGDILLLKRLYDVTESRS